MSPTLFGITDTRKSQFSSEIPVSLISTVIYLVRNTYWFFLAVVVASQRAK